MTSRAVWISGGLRLADRGGQRVKVGAVLDDLAVEVGEVAVGADECFFQVWSVRPCSGSEADKVAGGEVEPGVLKVDQGDRHAG